MRVYNDKIVKEPDRHSVIFEAIANVYSIKQVHEINKFRSIIFPADFIYSYIILPITYYNSVTTHEFRELEDKAELTEQ